MSDRNKSNPTPNYFPTSWEQSPAFRQAFLVHLPAEHAEGCEKLGEYVFEALLEAHMNEATPADLLRATAADLHVCHLVLKSLLDGYEGLALLDRIAGWNERIQAVAGEMKALMTHHAE